MVVNNDRVVVSSRKVAEVFGKNHKRVMQTIRELEIPNDIHGASFGVVEITEENAIGGTVDKSHYEITRDGFTLLGMGFTGKKAMEFKLKYIAAFNEMEQQLRSVGMQAPRSSAGTAWGIAPLRCGA